MKKHERTSEDMLDHFDSIELRPDDDRRQVLACAVHGFVHDSNGLRLMILVLSGVDITEAFSSAGLVKLCNKYGLTGGDSFDLGQATTCRALQCE